MRPVKTTTTTYKSELRFKLIFFIVLASFYFTPVFSQYTPGRLAVLVIGDGSAPLSSAAAPLFIRQYDLQTPAQTGSQITALPSTAVAGTGAVDRAVTQNGIATAEGFLNLSTDRRFLTLTGYNASAGTATVSTSLATTFPTNTRVIAKINANGISDTKTTLFTAYSGAAIRSAVTLDGSAYWTAGVPGTLGVGYVPQNNVVAATNLGANNTRGIGIFNNQLYVSTGTASNRLARVGSGLPVTGTQTLTNLSGFLTTTGDPYSYVFLDIDGNASPDVLYVASLNVAPIGLLKYTSSDGGATWTARGSLTGNVFGVTGFYNSCTGNVDLFITANTVNAKPNRLFKFRDLNVSVGSPANITSNGTALVTSGTLLATAATNTSFGGVAFTPGTLATTPAVFSVTGGNICMNPPFSATPGLSGSEIGVSYQLYSNGNPVGSPLTGTGNPLTFSTVLNAGIYTVKALNIMTGCESWMQGSLGLSAYPQVFSVTGGTVCMNPPFTATPGLSGSENGMFYEFYRNGILAGYPPLGTGNPLTFNVQNEGVYTVKAVDTITGCSSWMQGNFSLLVKPVPLITPPGPITSCPGTTISLTGSGQPGFIPPNGPGAWTISHEGGDNGTVNLLGVPDSITMTSSDGWSPGQATAVLYCHTVGADGFITFNWSYTTSDGPVFDFPQYSINGGTPSLFSGYDIYGLNLQNGTASIPVLAGQTFCLRMKTLDNVGGSATVAISNITFPNSPPYPVYNWSSGESTQGISVNASGSYSVTVTANNGCTGSSLPVLVNFADIIPPVITTCPADTLISCSEFSTYTSTVSATDNCSGTLTFSYVDSIINGNGCTNIVSRTHLVNDANGNTATCIQIITVVDVIAPVFEPVRTIFNVNCGDDTSPGALGTPVANDDCNLVTLLFTDSIIPGMIPSSLQIVRNWTATDACGNSAVLVQTINVSDFAPPVINCPQTITVCSPVPVPVSYNVTASDNCGLAGVNLLTNPGNESGNFNGWVFTLNGGDGWAIGGMRSGNFGFSGSYEWSEMVQEVDLIAKGYSSAYLNSAPPIHVSEWYRASACCSATDEYYFKAELLNSIGNVLGSYNLGSMFTPVQSTPVWQQVAHTFTGYPAGVTKVRITHGSKDNEYWAGNYGTEIDDAIVSIDTLIINPPSGSIFPLGTTAVTATAMDQTGQTSTCSFNVIVTNTPGPAISCSANIICAGDNDGVATVAVSDSSLKLNITAPTPLQFQVGIAVFGPSVYANPVSGDLKYFSNPDLGCTAYPPGFFTGKVALIDRGTCFFEEKIFNAQSAGAIGVVVVNNVPGPPVNMGPANLYPINIPAVIVSDVDGLAIKNMLSQPAVVTGNTTIYSYAWSNGATTASVSGLSAGIYTVSVSADNSCLSSCSVQVLENIPDSVVVISSSVNNTICQGDYKELFVDPINLAGNFNGNQQWYDLGADITNLNDASFTIEAWVRTTGTGEGIVVSSNNDNIWEFGERAFYIDANGAPAFVGYANQFILSNMAVNDGNWHHVAVVRDYSTLPGSGAIYIDGNNRTSSSTYSANAFSNIGSFSIGRPNNFEAPNYFSGDIDEVRIWNVARTATEIQTGIAEPLIGYTPGTGLLAYYKFDERPFLLMNYASPLYYGTPVNNPVKVNAFSYLWAPGGETTSYILPAASGDYTVTVTNYLGCTTTSQPYHLNVIPVPAAPVINIDPSPYFCTGDTITLSADTANAIIDLRYGSTVTGFSSEFTSAAWSANQILGAPDVFPSYGDIISAWAPQGQDNQREYIQVAYNNPAPVNFIDIYETFNPGAVDTVYVKNPGTGLFEVVYTASASPQPPVARKLHITFPVTSFSVSEIRIALNSPAVPDWNEIDAVGIGLERTYLWSTGATTSSIFVGSGGYYGLIVSNGSCQSPSTVIQVNELSSPIFWYADLDGDTFGDSTNFVLACSPPPGYVLDFTDCNDGLNTVYPGAFEDCTNGIDDNCNGIIDTDAVFYTYYQDLDFDDYGNPAVSILSCLPVQLLPGYTTDSTDCNDNSFFVNPGYTEFCDYLDNDCDGLVDEGVFFTVWPDADQDEYGDSQSPSFITCSPMQAAFGALNGLDCDDSNGDVNPGVAEVCGNSIDDNCNGQTDEGCVSLATFNITAFIEGYCSGGSMMQAALFNAGASMNPGECDYIRVELRDGMSTMTALAYDTATLNTSGQATVNFPGTVIGQNGYIVILHRNAVQTWSNLVTFTDTTNYNFTTAATQAFGSNQVEVAPGVWAFYSGDLFPQDEVVDIVDQIVLDNDVTNFASGYVVSDLTGDGLTDIVDQIIMDNNVFNFVSSNHP